MFSSVRRSWSRGWGPAAAALFVPGALMAAVSQGFNVPDGFEVSLFAGDDLAHDIYCMTTDHAGRIMVASRGWVKILHDTDGDGKADRATIFAEFPKSGAQGMYFDEEGLVVSGDQGVRRWRDRDGDGRAEGEAEFFFRTASGGEHGAHAIVKGPDGWFYLVAGNEAGIGVEHARLPGSPVKRVTAGAIVRFSPDGKTSEVVAHGFRNPYDFDFHTFGQIITYDSDGERDHHLPWYAGTRIFDVAIGAEHGWVLKGSPHAWSRPESWFDNTARLWTVGRGSPTAVAVYRHRAFPEHYRGGVFTACWTMGRVYFTPLVRDDSSFRAGLETFMEAGGTNGFAPVDALVGPDGDLFVAIGGRGTLGSVFRVHHVGAQVQPGHDPLRQVLAADQPLTSWSRARWVPQAKQLGSGIFEQAAANKRLSVPERVRAIEVLVEVFAGLRPDVVRLLTQDDEPELVARVAWALPRSAAISSPHRQLTELTRRDDPRIARGVGGVAFARQRQFAHGAKPGECGYFPRLVWCLRC
jgi:putative membrane-bound dehydrogenase-like protein